MAEREDRFIGRELNFTGPCHNKTKHKDLVPGKVPMLKGQRDAHAERDRPAPDSIRGHPGCFRIPAGHHQAVAV